MLKVVISGYGRMGHMIESVLQEKGIVCAGASEDIVSFDDDLARECVCIDFTCPDAFRANYPALASKFKAVVVGTTGWNDIRDEVIRCFEEKGTPMIYSSNYSDAPSGTAKSLAGVVSESFSEKFDVSSVRVGELAGIHTVGFEGENDRITIEHEAFSRRVFAEGAVVAAQMTEGLSGVHEFKELFFKDR